MVKCWYTIHNLSPPHKTSVEDRRYVYIKTLLTMSVTLRYIEICRHVRQHIRAQSIFSSPIMSLRNYNSGPWRHSSKLTQCDRHEVWICCESLQSQSLFTLTLCSPWSIWHLTDHRLFAS